MKWLLLLPLLLVACAPASDVRALQEQVAVLQAQYRDLQAIDRVRFDHLVARIQALECAADPEKLHRLGMDCP